MTRIGVCFMLCLAASVGIHSEVAAAPTVGQLTANRGLLVVQQPTAVTFTATITDPTYLAGSANLQRLVNGTWTILGTLQPAGGGVFTLTQTFNEAAVGEVRVRASAAFRGVLKRALSPEIAVPVGQRIPPGAGATITGPNGIMLTVAPGTAIGEIVAGVAPISPTTLPTGGRSVAAALALTVQTNGDGGIQLPLQLSVPAPAGTPNGTQFIVVRKVLVDFVSGTTGGLREALQPVEIATAAGGRLVTPATARTNEYPGILTGGTFAFIRNTLPSPP